MNEHKRIYHLQVEGKPTFISFRTLPNFIMSPVLMKIVFECCLYINGRSAYLHVFVVMSDHVHMIFTALNDTNGLIYRDGQIIKSIKGISAREINKVLKRTGNVWQKNYFDHYIKSDEELQQKVSYVVNNPVEEGLVKIADDYLWLWRRWVEGERIR